MFNIYFNHENLSDQIAEYWNKELRSFRKKGFVVSVIMIVLGVLCFVFPFKSAYAMEVIASVAILVIGITEIVEYAKAPVYVKFTGILASGILNVIMGLMLLSSPKEDLFEIFGFLFALDILDLGIEEVSAASRLQYFGESDVGWMKVSGIINIVAAVVFFFVPASSAAVLSVLVGVYLLIYGIALLNASRKAKELHINKNYIDVE